MGSALTKKQPTLIPSDCETRANCWLQQHRFDSVAMVLANGDTPLHAASRLGDVWMCKHILSVNGHNFLRHVNNNGETPLMVAVRYGHLLLCETLHNYDVAVGQSGGESDLMCGIHQQSMKKTPKQLLPKNTPNIGAPENIPSSPSKSSSPPKTPPLNVVEGDTEEPVQESNTEVSSMFHEVDAKPELDDMVSLMTPVSLEECVDEISMTISATLSDRKDGNFDYHSYINGGAIIMATKLSYYEDEQSRYGYGGKTSREERQFVIHH